MTRPLGRALGLLRSDGRRAGLGVVLNVATIGAGIGLIGTSAWLISLAALHPSIAVLQVAIVGVRFFGISRGVFRYLERVVSHDVTLRLLARLRTDVYRSLEPLAPARLFERRSGDVLHRLVGDVDLLEHLYVRVVGPSLCAVVVACLVAGLLGMFGARLAVAAVLGLAIASVVVPLMAWRLGERRGGEALRLRAEVQARSVDGLQGVADLLALGREHAFSRDLATSSARLAIEDVRAARISAAGTSLAGLAADLSTVAVLALAAPLVTAGHLDGAHVAVVALATLAAFEVAAAMPAAFQGLGAARAAAARVFDLTGGVPPVAPPASPVPVPLGERLDLTNLSFAYPGSGVQVLEEVNLHLERGRLVAVVGASGSGKSTIAHIIMRFWDVPAGTLWLDGHDVRTMDDGAFRERVAFVPQRPHVFTGTIAENLRLARPTASMEDLNEVSHRAGLASFVRSLPDGYDTWIGEQGVNLSGGQLQRLAVARALLKEAPLLVLDEPTAHLDAVSERAFLAQLGEMRAQRGVLLITHRLAGLETADEIVVLDRGRVRERGTFAELVAADGWFGRVHDLQRSPGVTEE